jgi:N utilization substance protein B
MSVSRRQARLFAVQVLYAHAIDGSPIQTVLDRMAEVAEPPAVGRDPFASALCRLTAENLERLDGELAGVVEHWRPERLLLVDRAILRLAACELLLIPDIPPRVTLNEYIEIAKVLGDEQSPGFVNGVLDRIMAQNPKAAGDGETAEPGDGEAGESPETGSDPAADAREADQGLQA